MPNDMLMRMKDQILIVLADYQTCKLDEIDQKVYLERESNRVAAEITRRVINNYMINVGVDVHDFYPKTIDQLLATPQRGLRTIEEIMAEHHK